MLAKLDSSGKLNVLIVDDDQDDVFVMCNAIQSFSHTSPFEIKKRVANDGSAAISIAQALHGTLDQPDLMLLDLNMPRLDGFEVLKRLRNDPMLMGMPVVVLTTASDEDTLANAKELGANAVLSKPRTQQDFDVIISDVFNTWLL